MFSDRLLRLRAIFRRARVEREVDEELRFHFDHHVDVYLDKGLDRSEATRRARLEFGGLDQLKEEYRDALGTRVVEGLWRDLRFGVRALRATPVVTIVATLSIALGIGANTAIFSLIDGLILRKLPVADPDRLVLVTTAAPGSGAWSYPVWKELERAQIFETAAAWSPRQFNLAAGGETQFVDGLWASGLFFETLGVAGALGRTFDGVDDQPGGGRDGPVAVISHRFWQRHFGAAADVIGRAITVDDRSYTIIGVTPPAFYGMEVGRTFDIALPLELNLGPRRPTTTWLTIVGRLAPGQTADAATARLQSVQPSIRDTTLPPNASAAYRQTYLQTAFAALPAATGSSGLRRQYQQPLITIMVVVTLVMLVASVNIANLLFARCADRRHEFSVRLALGALRWQLARQVLVESIVLAVAGASLGLLLATWGSRALVEELAKQTTTQSTAVFLDLSLNWHVLAFTAGVTVGCVLLFGVAPALRASRIASDMLREARVTTGHRRAGLSNSLVVVQLALSVVLVVAAGLFVRTFASLVSRPLGFDPDQVLVVGVRAERSPITPADRLAIFERATEAMRSLPGVQDAAASLLTPVSGLGLTNVIEVAGRPRSADGERDASVNHVSVGYFRTLGTPILAGRNFTDADSHDAPPVAIVNQSFSRRFLDGDNPLGQSIVGLPPAEAIPIVGVVADAVYRSLRESATPTVYLPFAQSREATAFAMMSLSIRSIGSPESLTRSVTTRLTELNPDLTWTFRPLVDQIDASITQERITAALAGSFGAVALLMAGLGLYGVTAHQVNRRRFEIGIRMALGATRASVIRLVVSRVAVFVGIGAAAGVVASLWSSRFVAALLYGLEPWDLPTLLGTVAALVTVGLTAGAVPAIRATRVDPAVVLRAE